MDRLLKLWPFVRPHRRRLAVAVVAAVFASSLWAGALLLTFPITKVLMQQQSLGTTLPSESRTPRNRHANTTRAAYLEAEIAAFETRGDRQSGEYLKLLQKPG